MEAILDQLVDWAQTQRDIMAVYLYGSQAREQATPLSDIDIGILARLDLEQSQLWHLEDNWAAEWPEFVDIRLLNLAPLPFQYDVMAHGRRLWTANTGAVAGAESLIWRKYWDLQPRLEQDWTLYVESVMEKQNEAEREQYQTTLAKVRAVHQRVREAAANYTQRTQE